MNKKGFTLIELLIVIVILGILFGMVLPTLRKLKGGGTPAITARVNDYSNVLNESDRQSLEKKLEQRELATTDQIAVVIIGDLGSRNIKEVAHETFKNAGGRGLGQKDKNNGVLIFWSTDAREVWIEPGDGLVDRLTAAVCGDIWDYRMKPLFRGNEYYKGLDAGIDSIMAAIDGKYELAAGREVTAPAGSGTGSSPGETGEKTKSRWYIMCVAAGIVSILAAIVSGLVYWLLTYNDFAYRAAGAVIGAAGFGLSAHYILQSTVWTVLFAIAGLFCFFAADIWVAIALSAGSGGGGHGSHGSGRGSGGFSPGGGSSSGIGAGGKY